MDVVKTIYGHWAELRSQGRLDEVLPSARAWMSVTPDGRPIGYDTLHYQFRRNVTIPGSGPTGGDEIAGLVESYYSIRHSNGWGHNLHVHVVEVKNETLQISHLAHLFRCVAGLRLAMEKTKIQAHMQAKEWLHRNLYIHGALLGPVASGDVLMAEAMLEALYDNDHNGYPQPPIRVGVMSGRSTKDISIKRIEPARNYFSDPLSLFSSISESADVRLPQLTHVLDDLLGSTPMWAEWTTARRGEENEHQARWEQERRAIEAQTVTSSAVKMESDIDNDDASFDSEPPGDPNLLN